MTSPISSFPFSYSTSSAPAPVYNPCFQAYPPSVSPTSSAAATATASPSSFFSVFLPCSFSCDADLPSSLDALCSPPTLLWRYGLSTGLSSSFPAISGSSSDPVIGSGTPRLLGLSVSGNTVLLQAVPPAMLLRFPSLLNLTTADPLVTNRKSVLCCSTFSCLFLSCSLCLSALFDAWQFSK